MDVKFSAVKIVFNRKRLIFFYSNIFIAFFILMLRLTYLHIMSSDQLISAGDMRSLRTKNVFENRGMITDRTGKLLAISIPVDAVWMNPQEVKKHGGIDFDISRWRTLSEILCIPLQKVSLLINEHVDSRFVYLARQIDVSIAKRIDQLNLPGIYLRKESKRYYPTGSIAAQLIGLTNIDGQGIEGVEKSFDAWLTGTPTIRVVRKDRSGRVIEDVALLKDGQSPENITLSIDERLQCFAYHALNEAVHMNKAESGSAVLIDIDTGEILIMANSPSYNPNDLSHANKLIMRNRAITDAFEPGSTVKPIVIMTALQHNIIKKDTIINTSPYVINGYKIKDVSYNDTLTVSEILRKSSNVGVSKLALSMPISVLIDSYINFGLGKTTNIGLVGENSGKIRLSNQYWSGIERATFSYGYGLMITPLQLAKVYATIGGMGIARPLSIVRVEKPILGHRVLPGSLVRTVIDMMENFMVSSIHEYSNSEIKGYRVVLKTGTVKKVGVHGKYVNKYIASAAGIAPAGNPRFALVVIINDPKNGNYYGGVVSVPVFKAIMNYSLKIMNVHPECIQ